MRDVGRCDVVHRHVSVSVMILVPLHLEGHQGAVGLCTGKPILDVFLKDTSHIYSPPSIPPLVVAQHVDGEASQSRFNFLTMAYNYLSCLQRTTVFIDGFAEKKVPHAALHLEHLALSVYVAGFGFWGIDPQIFAQISRAALNRQVAQTLLLSQTYFN
jgi:hypothetical protein